MSVISFEELEDHVGYDVGLDLYNYEEAGVFVEEIRLKCFDCNKILATFTPEDF